MRFSCPNCKNGYLKIKYEKYPFTEYKETCQTCYGKSNVDWIDILTNSYITISSKIEIYNYSNRIINIYLPKRKGKRRFIIINRNYHEKISIIHKVDILESRLISKLVEIKDIEISIIHHGVYVI